MRRILSTIVLASAALLLASCGSSQTKKSEKNGTEAEAGIMTDESHVYTELKKMPLPCSKELLYAAWKQIGENEASRGKALDYRQNSPVFFISTDLDEDGNPEVLLRSEPPYAAIFTFLQDSLQLITYVEHPQVGLGITPDGCIVRNGTGGGNAYFSEFIRLENSEVAAKGMTRETFSIQDNAMRSDGTEYMLQTDTAKAKVSKEEYQKVAPAQSGTYLEDIEGWEDFRKP